MTGTKLRAGILRDMRFDACGEDACGADRVPSPEVGDQCRAVSVDRAAELLSLSPHTIRKYVVERRLYSVRGGRRVLTPMDTVEKVLREGVPRSRG